MYNSLNGDSRSFSVISSLETTIFIDILICYLGINEVQNYERRFCVLYISIIKLKFVLKMHTVYVDFCNRLQLIQQHTY